MAAAANPKSRAYCLTHFREDIAEMTPDQYLLTIPGVAEGKDNFGVVAGKETCPESGRLHMQGEKSPIKKARRVNPIVIPEYTFDPIRKQLFSPSPIHMSEYIEPTQPTTFIPETPPHAKCIPFCIEETPVASPCSTIRAYDDEMPDLCERCDRYFCDCSVYDN